MRMLAYAWDTWDTSGMDEDALSNYWESRDAWIALPPKANGHAYYSPDASHGEGASLDQR